MKNRSKWGWFFLAAAILGFFLSSDGMRSYWRQKTYLSEIQEKLQNLKAENGKLALEIQRFRSDPRSYEQYARKELGLIQPGEIEYRFISTHSSPTPEKRAHP